MPKIAVNYPHGQSDISIVKAKVQELGIELQNTYHASFNWKDDRSATIEMRGAKGLVQLDDKKILVNIDLPILLSPLKQTVENKIKTGLDQLFK